MQMKVGLKRGGKDGSREWSDDTKAMLTNWNMYMHQLDAIVRDKLDRRSFHQMLGRMFAKIKIQTGESRSGVAFRDDDLETPDFCYARTGVNMEQANELLKATNEEVTESKKVLQKLANEVRAVADQVNPMLIAQIQTLRQNRMATVREIQDTLAAMREIRKFFIESEHSKEMERLKEFVALCKDIAELKTSGVLDCIMDSIISLALKEEKK